MKILEAKNITKMFPGVIALDSVDVAFEPGEIHAIIGENGAGKSTLIKCLTGVYEPEEGEVMIGGENAMKNKALFDKIAVCDFDGTEKRLRAYFQERFGDRIKIVTSGNIWIDFIAPNANKGSALSNIVSSLGMDPKNGITFGDQYNDLEMLQLSNTSYAMTTAATGVADYATHTTDSVEKTLKDLLKNL